MSGEREFVVPSAAPFLSYFAALHSVCARTNPHAHPTTTRRVIRSNAHHTSPPHAIEKELEIALA